MNIKQIMIFVSEDEQDKRHNVGTLVTKVVATNSGSILAEVTEAQAAQLVIKTCAIIFFALMLGTAGYTVAGESMKLSENDSGNTVEIRIDDELEVVLPANPTTGYIWEVDSLDSTVLRRDKSVFLASDNALGSGGMEIIKLHAIAAGKSLVSLIFHRPFEQNMPPLKTFEVTVIIK